MRGAGRNGWGGERKVQMDLQVEGWMDVGGQGCRGYPGKGTGGIISLGNKTAPPYRIQIKMPGCDIISDPTEKPEVILAGWRQKKAPRIGPDGRETPICPVITCIKYQLRAQASHRQDDGCFASTVWGRDDGGRWA